MTRLPLTVLLVTVALVLGAMRTEQTSAQVGDAARRAATAVCSRPQARVELERVGIAHGSVGAAQVICADLTRDGSTEMIASAATPGSAGVLGWAIFRETRGRWSLALDRRRAYSPRLLRLGPDVLEILPVYRRGDAQCCPSGARDTLYHWNGRRFMRAYTWTQ